MLFIFHFELLDVYRMVAATNATDFMMIITVVSYVSLFITRDSNANKPIRMYSLI